LVLGGEAVYRGDNWLVFVDGFKVAEAHFLVGNELFRSL
jgi:diadenosine tetraphosphate (Ap4A) HIT family hydrolase